MSLASGGGDGAAIQLRAGDPPADGGGGSGSSGAADTARWMDEAVRPDLFCAPAGGGRALDPGVQRSMEGSFGADFSAVRVHEGGHVPALGALAYTQGADVHFAPGQYDPSSTRGRELIGHELAHVVQQAEGRVSTPAQAKGAAINADAGLEAEADELGSRAARGEQVRSGPTVSAGGAGAIQRFAFVGGSQITARDPRHTPRQTTFVTDAVVRDYRDATEFANHAASSTDYLGNLTDGTWVRFEPTGINLLGENHTIVRLEEVAPAVGTTNFIYERFSNDTFAAGSHMGTAYQADSAASRTSMGIAGAARPQDHGAESLYPKVGFIMTVVLPNLNPAGLAQLRPPNYDGQPAARYFKIGWGFSEDNLAEVTAARAAHTHVGPRAAALATLHPALAPRLAAFIGALPVDGYLGDAIAALPAADQGPMFAALRQLAQALIDVMAERALTEPSAGLNASDRHHFGPHGHADNADRRRMFSTWRDNNFEESVRAATARGVRYAGMGFAHLQNLLSIGLAANQHPFDMAAADLARFRAETTRLRGLAHPVP